MNELDPLGDARPGAPGGRVRLAPPVRPAPRRVRRCGRALTWVLVAMAVVAALAIAVPRLRARFGEAGARLADGAWVPLAELATPLQARPAVQLAGRYVHVGLVLHDAGFRVIRELNLPSGGQPDPPRVTIRDADGRVIHTGRMEYG